MRRSQDTGLAEEAYRQAQTGPTAVAYLVVSLGSLLVGIGALVAGTQLGDCALRAEEYVGHCIHPGLARFLALLAVTAALAGALATLQGSIVRRESSKRMIAAAFLVTVLLSAHAGGWSALVWEAPIRIWAVGMAMAGMLGVMAIATFTVLVALHRLSTCNPTHSEATSRVAVGMWLLGGLWLTLHSVWGFWNAAVRSLPSHGGSSLGIVEPHIALKGLVFLGLGSLAVVLGTRHRASGRHTWVELAAPASFIIVCGVLLFDASRWALEHWSYDFARLAPGRTVVAATLLAGVVTGFRSARTEDRMQHLAVLGGGILVAAAIAHAWYSDFGQLIVCTHTPGSGSNTVAYPLALALGTVSLALSPFIRIGSKGTLREIWPIVAYHLGAWPLVFGVYAGGLGTGNWRGNAVASLGGCILATGAAALLARIVSAASRPDDQLRGTEALRPTGDSAGSDSVSSVPCSQPRCQPAAAAPGARAPRETMPRQAARQETPTRAFSRSGRALLFVCVAIGCAGACTRQGVCERRGAWEAQYRVKWSFTRGYPPQAFPLYRYRGSEKILVAADARFLTFHPEDCVVYFDFDDRAGGYFAACGDRHPLRLSTHTERCHVEVDRFVRFPAAEEAGAGVSYRLIKDILDEATRQPLTTTVSEH